MINKQPLLKIENISMKFGGLTALDQISFEVYKGEIVSIIGPNGAGKTTLFNVISGIYGPISGQVYLEGKPISNLKPYDICKMGLCRTFQTIRLFGELNVFENVLCARHCRTKSGVFHAILTMNRAEREESKRAAFDLLKEYVLDNVWDQSSDKLSYGNQRRLEMVRALATEPSILLLDEPAAGLNPSEIEEFMSIIKDLCNKGKTILLVEHRMNLVMNISTRIVVLDYGKKIAEGSAEEIQKNSKVIKAYLGDEGL